MSRAHPVDIAPLDRDRHDRAAFSCGHPALDRYLHEQAGQDTRKRVAAVFVATRPGGAHAILGYYTLAQASVTLDALPMATRKRLPRYPDVPVTLLGRLAVHRHEQGAGLGRRLLGDACRRAAAVATEVASAGIIVDAIDDKAERFYRTFGFEPFRESPHRLFLPMGTIMAGLAAL